MSFPLLSPPVLRLHLSSASPLPALSGGPGPSGTPHRNAMLTSQSPSPLPLVPVPTRSVVDALGSGVGAAGREPASSAQASEGVPSAVSDPTAPRIAMLSLERHDLGRVLKQYVFPPALWDCKVTSVKLSPAEGLVTVAMEPGVPAFRRCGCAEDGGGCNGAVVRRCGSSSIGGSHYLSLPLMHLPCV